MQLLIKQRVFSWTDTYDVYDEYGNVRYFVKAEFFSLGHRLHVFDAAGNEIGLVRQKLLTFEKEAADLGRYLCHRIYESIA